MAQANFKPSDLVDFVVIGAGAAGGGMAKELSVSGFRVVVLEILNAAGALRTWTASLMAVEDVLPSRHLMGTCRMGNDARHSVVDRYHRTHDVPNLFLVDGSSFVTSARQQPTCTIQALAFRAAERIVQQARNAQA